MPAADHLDRELVCLEAIRLVERPWILSSSLAIKVARVLLRTRAEIGRERVDIISGYRSAAQQADLARQGRPAAPDALSTHRACPSQGADITLGFPVTTAMKATFGRIVVEEGLRWGGGSPVDPETGIPSDWQHVDEGPRE